MFSISSLTIIGIIKVQETFNSSKSIFTNFKNLNTFIYLKINKYYINENSYLSNIQGEFQIKNNKLINSNVSAKLNKSRKFQLNIFTNNTPLTIDTPKKYFDLSAYFNICFSYILIFFPV